MQATEHGDGVRFPGIGILLRLFQRASNNFGLRDPPPGGKALESAGAGFVQRKRRPMSQDSHAVRRTIILPKVKGFFRFSGRFPAIAQARGPTRMPSPDLSLFRKTRRAACLRACRPGGPISYGCNHKCVEVKKRFSRFFSIPRLRCGFFGFCRARACLDAADRDYDFSVFRDWVAARRQAAALRFMQDSKIARFHRFPPRSCGYMAPSKLVELGSRWNETETNNRKEDTETNDGNTQIKPSGYGIPRGRPDQPPQASLASSVERLARSVDSEP